MNRKYTMDVATVRERVDQIVRDIGAKKWQLADSSRDRLQGDILRAIAYNECADPQACAIAVMHDSRIDFSAVLEWRT